MTHPDESAEELGRGRAGARRGTRVELLLQGLTAALGSLRLLTGTGTGKPFQALAPGPQRRARQGRKTKFYARCSWSHMTVGVGVAADCVSNLRATLGCSLGLAVLCLWSAAVVYGRSRTGARAAPRPRPN